MKKFLLVFLSVFTLNSAFAQPAMDFTATDINGNEHNLFEYLDAGKTVILDVSATWCGPCWVFHQNHYLEDLYNTYGPGGSDEIVVLFYEGDANTNSDDLNGIGNNTIGDWVTGTSYPIINPPTIDTAFMNLYAPFGYPTVSVICPDSKEIIADVYDQNLRGIIEQILNCQQLDDVTDLSFSGVSSSLGTCDGTVDLFPGIYNSGFDDVSDFEVSAKDADGVVINTATFVGTLAPNEIGTVDLGAYTFAGDVAEITYEININDLFDNNQATFEYSQGALAANNIINVYIEGDIWVADDPTYWYIEDDNGNIVVQGDPMVASAIVDQQVSLPSVGCYHFFIIDEFGDGLETPISITDADGNVFFNNSNFGFLGQSTFEVSSISDLQETLDFASVKVFPSPVQDELNLQMNILDAGRINIQITDATGKVVENIDQNFTAGTSTVKVNTSNLSNGLYFISMKNGEGVISRRFVKQ